MDLERFGPGRVRRAGMVSSAIVLAALAGVLPLMLHGLSCGHDFDFHLLNWLEAGAQMRGGNLHPQWAVSPAWNAGEPRFIFYPPLSWMLGGILGTVLPWVAVPVVYTWICLCGAGLAMYRLAREYAQPAAAVLAGIVYALNPYMLFTAYERAAYGELLAAVWLPLLFLGVLGRRAGVAGVAVPLALLWLTNAPGAVMGTYALALLAAVRLALPWRGDRRWRVAGRVVAGTGFGLAMAAFYIVPAFLEQPRVQVAMAVIPGMRIEDNTLFHHTGAGEDAAAHDAVLHTASALAVLLLAATALALLGGYIRSRGDGDDSRGALRCLAVLSGAIGLMLTRLSLPVWRYAPELAFLQFSWRLLAVLATGLALAAAITVRQAGWRWVGVALLVMGAAAWAAGGAFRQECDAEDTVAARVAVFRTHTGSEPTDEYTPAEADNDALRHRNPPFWLAADPDAEPDAEPDAQTDADSGLQATDRPGPAPRAFSVAAPRDEYLVLNLRRYPDWHVRRNGTEVPFEGPRDDGLAVIAVPGGRSYVELQFRETHTERAAEAFSLISVLALAGLRWRRARL